MKTEFDTSYMLFDPKKVKHPKDLFKVFPELELEPDFVYYNGGMQPMVETEKGEDEETEVSYSQLYDGVIEQHMLYVMWLFDNGSPLIKAMPEMSARRLQAAELSGLLDLKKHWELAQNDRNELVQQMAAAFVRLQNHAKFEAIISLEIFVHNQWDVVRQKIPFNMNGMDGDKVIKANEVQSKCAEAAYKFTERLEKLKTEFIAEQREMFGIVVLEPENKKKNRLHYLAEKNKQERRKRMESYTKDQAPKPEPKILEQEEEEVLIPEEKPAAPERKRPVAQAAAGPIETRERPTIQVPTRGA